MDPTIVLSRSDMLDFVYEEDNGPSPLQSFTVKASGLSDSVTLDAPTNFEISTDGSNFSPSLTLSQTNGFIDETNIYIQFKAGLGLGVYNETFNATSTGATQQDINLTGEVRKPIELFITEVLDPSDEGFAKYIEIYNAGVTPIDFEAEDYYFSSQINGSIESGPIKLEGSIAPKSYYIITSTNPVIASSYDKAYSRPPDISLNANFGNFDDTFFLSTSGSSYENATNTMFDIYGKLGVLGQNSPWDYRDSHAYRKNPDVKKANINWNNDEWEIENATTLEATPGYGDNDYIFDNDWLNLNTGLGNSGNPIGESTTAQNIFIKSGTATLSDDTDIGDLVVRSGALLRIEAGVKLKVTGDIVNLGKIIFESDATEGSAVLEAVSENTRVVGDNFEIHRYIPDSNRAFRYLALPVTTSTTTINENWQEGVNNESVGVNENPNEGFGTHITGTDLGPNLGFDATETGNPSMFQWNVNSQQWESIPNTNIKTFEVGEAYAILIRGDRSSPLNSNFDMGPPTTLRTTGKIHVGDFDVDNTVLSNTSSHFNLIGNPYQSQVDLKVLMENHAQDLDPNKVYVYDPTLGERGGYATIDLYNLSFSSVPSGTNANQYLQPNQAFFVQTTGASPELTFKESAKNNNDIQTTTFSFETETPSHININLKYDDQTLVDGVRVVLDNTYSENVDYFDAVKAWNFDESLTIYSKNTNLSIEKRPQPTATDTTQLHLYNYTKSSYTIEVEFIAETYNSQDIFLIDQYTEQSIAVTPNQQMSYEFTIDSNIPESVSPDRFLITYETSTLSVNDFENEKVTIYPNPLSGEQLFIALSQTWIGKSAKFRLFDLSGRLIDTWDFDHLKSQEILNLNNLHNGLYILQLTNGENIETFKLKKN